MHRRFFHVRFRELDIVGIGVLFAFAEVLLGFALELFSTTLDVLTGIVSGIPEIAANPAFHFFGGAFDFVLYTAFVEILHFTLPWESSVLLVSEAYKAKGMPSLNGCFCGQVSTLQRPAR
jgi:hypothetical protein